MSQTATHSFAMLAIETATSACSVALAFNGDVFSRAEVGSNIHSQVLLSMVQQLLDESGCRIADLNAVAVGQGPGSFTGLRIGVGVAQGIAYGAGCDMVGVSSLDVLAHQAEYDGAVLAGIDARMGEIYWCDYIKSGDQVKRMNDLTVSAPAQISSAEIDCQFVGNAWVEYQNDFPSSLNVKPANDQPVFPDAKSLLVLAKLAFDKGETISPIEFAPEYVRNNVAKKSQKPVK